MRLSFDGDAETGFYSYYFVEERIMKAKKGGGEALVFRKRTDHRTWSGRSAGGARKVLN
jgi:hypothetical protein